MRSLYFISLLILFNVNTSLAQWPQIQLNQVIDGIERPVLATHAGDNSGRLFIVEQSGKIRILSNDVLLTAPFLDITDRIRCCGESGLLSVAFPSGYGTNKFHFYVNYTNTDGDTIVSRFTLLSTNQADPSSEEILLEIEQPFSNHNGGQLAFGPDGMLYIGMGDGGSDGIGGSGDSAQKPDSLHGKILRIDVENGAIPYAIPADNPFVNLQNVPPEIWSYGLRNPWRFSFDRSTGDLYIADVGEDSFEEINVQDSSSKGGENYGWNILEGVHCLGDSNCDKNGLIFPQLEYSHSEGNCSVTGGYVYRGATFPTMQGVYLFGDFCSGQVGGLRRTDTGWESTTLLETPHSITSFGEDESGNVYLASFNGVLYQIVETVEIAFSGLEPVYSAGQTIQLSLNELSGPRSGVVDLWVAVQMPNNDLLFLNSGSGLTPLPFKTNVPVNETSQPVTIQVPSEISSGTYTLFAVYSEQGATFDQLGAKLRSNLLSQTTRLQ
jgi:glucose/arabinose dehydrogenase